MLGAQEFSGPDGYERSRPSRGPHPRPSGRGIRRARAAPATQPEARQRPEAGRAATGTAYPECLLGLRSSISRILGSPAAGAVPSGVPLPQQRQRLAGHVPLGERARVATDAPGPPGVGLRTRRELGGAGGPLCANAGGRRAAEMPTRPPDGPEGRGPAPAGRAPTASQWSRKPAPQVRIRVARRLTTGKATSRPRCGRNTALRGARHGGRLWILYPVG